ncbi:MAG: flavodoxin family protein [Thermoplasmatales archaeon]|nr:flavodoxin family protein [Thermoplasmatales archaeon]
MTKTLVILGSPRKGANSETIAMAMAGASEKKGNTVKTYRLNDLKNVKGCQGCNACKEKGYCIVKDDHALILADVKDADSIIMASPTYYGEVSGQLRLFMDRFYSFLDGGMKSTMPKGKKVAICVTCMSGLEGAKGVADWIEKIWAKYYGQEIVGKIVRGGSGAPTDASNDAEVMAQAVAVGAKL